ncbi:MAG: hypothetical protein HN929_06590, partial [Chloroflexi bacterium]|nr:hypothetical protein [Chloroflexota bacterium]
PPANISISGTEASRTLTIVNAASATSGNATVTVSVSDGTSSSNTDFSLVINPCESGSSGSILSASTYSGNSVCGDASNDVIIKSGNTVTWDGTSGPLTGTIKVETGGILQITGAGGTISGEIELNGGTLDIDDDITISSEISHTANSTINVASGKTLTYTGDSLNIGPYTLTLSGAGNINNSADVINLNDPSAVLNVTGTGTILGGVQLSGGTLDIDESMTISGPITHITSSSVNIASGKTLLYNNATDIQLGAYTLTVVGAGTLNNTANIALNNNSSKLLISGTNTISGNTIMSLGTTGTIQVTGAATISGNIQMADGTLDADESFSFTGDLTFTSTPTINIATGKTITYNGATVDLSTHTLTLDGDGTFGGTGDIELAGGTLDVSGDVFITTDLLYSTATAASINITSLKTLTYTGTSISIPATNLSFNGQGTLTTTNPVVLGTASSVLTLNGAGAAISSVSVTGADLVAGNIDVDANATIGTLTLANDSNIVFAGGAVLSITNAFEVQAAQPLTTSGTGTLDVNGALTASDTITVPVGTTLDLSDGSLVMGTDVNIAGTLTASDTTTDVTVTASSTLTTANAISVKSLDLGDLILTLGSATSDLTVADAVTFNAGGERIISQLADLTLTNTVIMTAGQITSTSGNITLNGSPAAGTFLTLTGSTLTLNGNVDTTLTTFTAPTNLAITAAATLTTNSATIAATDLTLNDLALTLANTNLTVTNAVTLDNANEQIITGTNNLTLSAAPTFSDGAITSGGGNITLAANTIISGGTLNCGSSTLVLNGDLTLTGATFTAPDTLILTASSTLTGAGTITVATLNLTDLALTLASTNLTVTNAVTLNVLAEQIISGTNDLIPSAAPVMSNGSITSTGGSVTLQGTPTGGTLTLGGTTLILIGNLDTTATAFTAPANLTLSANATLTTTAALSITTLSLGDFALTLGNDLTVANAVTFDNANEQIITAGNDLTLSAAPTFTNGAITSTSGTITLAANSSISGGTFDLSGSKLTLSGDANLTGTTLTAPNVLEITGNATLTGAGTITAATLTLNNLALTLASTNLTVTNAVTIDNANEQIITAGNNLTLTAAPVMSLGQVTSSGGSVTMPAATTITSGTFDMSSTTLVLTGAGTFDLNTAVVTSPAILTL